MFDNDFKIRVTVKEHKPTVSLIGGPISNGELRVLIDLIKTEYQKYIREMRYESGTEKSK
jgi:hypothetical protein